MKLSQLNNKNIAIWGFGVEGKASAEYLSKHNIGFTVLCKSTEAVTSFPCVTDDVTTQRLNEFDVVVKSPGISAYKELIQQCKAQFTSPTAIWFANEKYENVIAITGTKGKSTSASLLTHIIKSCGKSVNLVGNIGQALISSQTDYDYIVLEASSFQIFDGNIRSKISMMTNLYPEHLDWHCGADNYFKDKLKILKHAQIKIINATNSNLKDRVTAEGCLYFNSKEGYHVINDALYYQQNKILDLTEIQLIGQHNLENIGAVLTICQQLQLDMLTCVEAIKSFAPLEHRLQNLGKIGDHFAINDSISTTPIATLAALQVVDLSRTTLLIGGFDRGNDWTEFAESLNKSPPNLLLISGQNGKTIYDHLIKIKAQFEFKLYNNLSDAIQYAQLKSPNNHTLLLSPGAPSFDQFDSYIQRGDFFHKELKNNAK